MLREIWRHACFEHELSISCVRAKTNSLIKEFNSREHTATSWTAEAANSKTNFNHSTRHEAVHECTCGRQCFILESTISTKIKWSFLLIMRRKRRNWRWIYRWNWMDERPKHPSDEWQIISLQNCSACPLWSPSYADVHSEARQFIFSRHSRRGGWCFGIYTSTLANW